MFGITLSVKFHIGWTRERNISYESVEILTMRLIMIRNEVKRTISISNGFELLQIVLEPDTGRCASKDAGPPKAVDCEILR